MRVGGPVIRLFDGAANRLLRVLGITPIQEAHGTITSEDLAQIIGTSGSAGHLTPEESGLLARALDFSELTAADVMVPRPQVTTLPENACGSQLRDILLSTGHSRIPLVREATETVVGVVSVKAFLSLPPDKRDDAPIGPLASQVLRVPETAPLAQVVAQMRRGRTQFAVAVDETGADVGVLTLEDVVEELVGEVRDEYDNVEAPPPADAAVVSGSLHLHEVARQTGVDLPDGDYDTVAGLVLSELGRLAKVGDEVVVAATRRRSDQDSSPRLTVTLRVDSLDGRRVGDVHLSTVAEVEQSS
jgi:CBS domain containing-hemolysin-like protein